MSKLDELRAKFKKLQQGKDDNLNSAPSNAGPVESSENVVTPHNKIVRLRQQLLKKQGHTGPMCYVCGRALEWPSKHVKYLTNDTYRCIVCEPGSEMWKENCKHSSYYRYFEKRRAYGKDNLGD